MAEIEVRVPITRGSKNNEADKVETSDLGQNKIEKSNRESQEKHKTTYKKSRRRQKKETWFDLPQQQGQINSNEWLKIPNECLASHIYIYYFW